MDSQQNHGFNFQIHKKSYYSLKMNEKVIALIDMDCFYVQVANMTIPQKKTHNLIVKAQPLQPRWRHGKSLL